MRPENDFIMPFSQFLVSFYLFFGLVDCSEGMSHSDWPCSLHNDSDQVYTCSNAWFRDQCLTICYDDCKTNGNFN